jgi:hypothetical protein
LWPSTIGASSSACSTRARAAVSDTLRIGPGYRAVQGRI